MLSGRRAGTQKICSSSLYVGGIPYDMSASILMYIMVVHFRWTFCCENLAFPCLKNEKNIHLMNMLSEYLCVFFEI